MTAEPETDDSIIELLSDESLPPDEADRRAVRQKLTAKLDAQSAAWQRWFTKLKRAFHECVKIDRRGKRLKKQLDALPE